MLPRGFSEELRGFAHRESPRVALRAKRKNPEMKANIRKMCATFRCRGFEGDTPMPTRRPLSRALQGEREKNRNERGN